MHYPESSSRKCELYLINLFFPVHIEFTVPLSKSSREISLYCQFGAQFLHWLNLLSVRLLIFLQLSQILNLRAYTFFSPRRYLNHIGDQWQKLRETETYMSVVTILTNYISIYASISIMFQLYESMVHAFGCFTPFVIKVDILPNTFSQLLIDLG